MPAGRPTDYKEEYCSNVVDYLKTTGREQTTLPTIEGFCLYIGVPRRTVYEWRDKHEEFSHTLDLILTVQKEQLTNDGIYGGKEVNATIVKLMLQNNHGMKERQDLTTDDEKMEGLVIIKDGDKS